jgi:hypothetical protein
METIRKFFCFICAAVAVFATIGCTAYLFYFGKPLFAVACLCLAAMATPFVIERVKELLK